MVFKMPYLVVGHASITDRIDPYANLNHVLPNTSNGVRRSALPRSKRPRLSPYGTPTTVSPLQTVKLECGRPTLSDVQPLRLLSGLFVMVLIVLICTFFGMFIAHQFMAFTGNGAQGLDNQDISTRIPTTQWKQGSMPELYSADLQWAEQPYGTQTIRTAGAGVLCLAMARIELTGDRSVGPIEVATFAQSKGYADQSNTDSLLSEGASGLGLLARPVQADQMSIRRQLNAGFPLICAVDAPEFGDATYIAVCGIDRNGLLIIHNPSSVECSNRHWSFDSVLSSCSALWSYSLLNAEES